jgi:hypothetical protein
LIQTIPGGFITYEQKTSLADQLLLRIRGPVLLKDIPVGSFICEVNVDRHLHHGKS